MRETLRRDPRREWIARNRLHPEHASVLADMGGGAIVSEWFGPSGVVRKNPRAVGFIGPNGVKRIDRSGLQQGEQSAVSATTARDSRRAVHIEQPAFVVAVVPDLSGGRLSSHDKDLLGLARRPADADPQRPGAVLAILFGDHKETALGDAGIDRVVHLEDELYTGYAPEARLAALGAVAREMAPRFWLLPDSPLGAPTWGVVWPCVWGSGLPRGYGRSKRTRRHRWAGAAPPGAGRVAWIFSGRFRGSSWLWPSAPSRWTKRATRRST